MHSEIDSYQKMPINPSEICTRAFELMQGKQYDEAEKLLNKMLGRVDDNVAVGLFHSSLGVLYKLKGEPKTAWKHYQRAEKLIPDDPALKIIMARLLIDQFAEYDQAIRKIKKIEDQVKNHPVFYHQVLITTGLAYLGKGQKKKATELLIRAMADDFRGFVSTKNIDFTLTEMLLRRSTAIAECRMFLEKARLFAEVHREPIWAELIDRMLEAFPKET